MCVCDLHTVSLVFDLNPGNKRVFTPPHSPTANVSLCVYLHFDWDVLTWERPSVILEKQKRNLALMM